MAIIEAHEEFVQRLERGSARMRTLSAITIVVSCILCASYIATLLLPYATGEKTVQVSLSDPFLQASELAVAALAAAWLYIGVSDYRFSRRMAEAIRKARAQERELEGRVSG